jgi:hypothetical protein
MLGDKELVCEGECHIPANLMNASLSAAGIKEKITEPVTIPKGNMPLTLTDPNMKSITGISIQITTEGAKQNYLGHVTLLR